MIAVAVFVGAAAIGHAAVGSFIGAGHPPEYYRAQFAPAVLLACGHGFVNPTDGAAATASGSGFDALSAFLDQQRNSLECSELPASFTGEPLNLFQDTHRYLMMLATAVWMVTGISWPALTIVSALMAGVTAALVYLLARTGMGRVLALAIAAFWITSPVQLEQLPHLRDYAKAPFFLFTLCAVAWIALTRASRRRTVGALAIMGAILGFGFGFRTDVVSYLPFVLLAVLAFRPQLDRSDLATRGLAAGAAVAAFLVAASPILLAFQSADNLAHVALLGLTDPSRDWLQLRDAPYSYGYLYHDGYVATVTAAYSERLETSTSPLLLGTSDYTKWSDEYYRRLITAFPGDTLVRAWAAVLGVFQLPFHQVNIARPMWIDPAMDAIFRYRGSLLSWLTVLPPFVAATIVAVGTSAVSLRLFGVLLLFGIIVPGMTAIQFHERHVFHLEILPALTYGCLFHFVWTMLRRQGRPRPAAAPMLIRATLVAIGLAAFVVVPVVAARAHQAGNVTALFMAYESAEVDTIAPTQELHPDGQVLLAADLDAFDQPPHFVDTNVLTIAVSGDRCDSAAVPLTLRYRVVPPFTDLTRRTIVPVPAAGSGATRLVFPVYTLGVRSPGRESLSFAGVEVAAADEPCIQSLSRFKKPQDFPLILESVLLPDWRQRPLYEALRELEPRSDDWRTENYSIPDGLRPGGRRLLQLAPENAPVTYRSPQVRNLNEREIEIRGGADSSAAYLLSWADTPRAKGSVFYVEGDLVEGGLTAGIQAKEQWVQQVSIVRPGRFRVAIQVEEAGSYGAVLANNQQQGLHSRITITRYGWLPPAAPSP